MRGFAILNALFFAQTFRRISHIIVLKNFKTEFDLEAKAAKLLLEGL